MRSLLFVPGDSERKLEKAFASGADVLLIDLEDSVAPQNKAAARVAAAKYSVEHRAAAKALIYFRVNDFSSGLLDEDLRSVTAARPDGIMLPKTAGLTDVERLSARLRVAEAEHDLPDGSVRILPIISETAAGVFGASTYGRGHERLAGVTWGAEDLSAAIGARATRDEAGHYTEVFRLARSLTLLAATDAQVAAIDTVFVDFRYPEGLRRECLEAERDGFTGKMAIHPDQVPIINEAFTPSPEAVAEARAVVEAFAAAGNPGVVGIGGRMYDRPHLKRAERLLARSGQALSSD
ncbi:CoA ester lyase [Pseudaminobacter sp. 19-2017]|uniref:CoA ester lyase n=1 Tax=Pseudaminobacter soli (ex Zhang et al. 2022) TaxID=2831468 RepID=A0A942I2E4_9HYPH|nr:CoA ester lyase [Pseudaminobacter soli]MBS3649547.1 CoA ester lyase [Pseudaminobacter soli]